MSEQIKDMWSYWQNMQESMMNLWAETMPTSQPTGKQERANGESKDLWQQWWQNQEKVFQIWKGTMTPAQPEKMMETFGQQFKDLTQEWWRTQEKMFDFWKESLNPAAADKNRNTEVFGEQLKERWQGWLKGQENMFKLWQEFMLPASGEKMTSMFSPKEWQERINKFYQDWMKLMAEGFKEYMKWIPNSPAKETFEKTLHSVNIYTSLLSFWSEILDKLPGKNDADKWKDFSQTWVQNYHGVLDEFFSLFMPEQFRKLLLNPTETTGIYQQIIFNFFRPWMESSAEMQQKFIQVLKGDRGAYLDFLKIWQQSFQESYGRVFHLPTFGLSRESFTKLMESMDAYSRYLSEINEFSAAIYQVGADTMEKLFRQYVDMLAEGKSPLSFKEFYQLWWKTNEDAYQELFKTENYARMMGDTVDAWMDFKKHYDSLLMEFFSLLPVPNRSEMDSLYKTVYQMKKKIKEQGKRIDQLMLQIDEIKG